MIASRHAVAAFSLLRRPRRFAAMAVLGLGLALAACTQPTVATQTPADQQEVGATEPPPPPVEPAPPPVVESEPAVEPAIAALPPDEAAPGAIQGRAEAVRIGLLVPLSGSHQAEGRALLDAAQMALFDVGDERFTLMPADTGGNADGAASAAARLLGAGASLLLGPLFGEEALAVAPIAKARGVNLVAFSNNPNAASDGVYLLGHMARQEVSRLIRHAHASGWRRFAVLAPSDGYGRLVAELVREAVPREGAELGPILFYAPSAGADDLELVVTALAQSGPFDALVLPDGGLRLLRLLPQLAVKEFVAPKVKLLGTGLWDDPSIHTEPALLGAWYVSAQPEGRAAFRQRLKEIYGYDPHRIAPLGYDAAALAILLAQTPTGPDFGAKALLDQRGFFGTEGIFRFSPDGTAERGLAVLEIGGAGAVVVADPAPQRFPSGTTAGGSVMPDDATNATPPPPSSGQ